MDARVLAHELERLRGSSVASLLFTRSAHLAAKDVMEPENYAQCDMATRSEHPAFHANRILLVMSKRAFRGHQGLFRSLRLGAHLLKEESSDLRQGDRAVPIFNVNEGTLEATIECSKDAMAIQQAASTAHVALLIRPLEAAGFTVDVILSASIRCRTPDTLASYREHLSDWYGRHRLALVDVHQSNETTQARATLSALRNVKTHLLRSAHSPGGPRYYHSALFWRFDVVPIHPIATVTAPTGTPLPRAALRRLMRANVSAALYPLWARELIASYGGDILMSLPGWALPCALRHLEVCCGGEESADVRRKDVCLGFRAVASNLQGNFCEHSFLLRQATLWARLRGDSEPRLAAERAHAWEQVGGAAPVVGSAADASDAGVLITMERTWISALAFRAPVIYRGPHGPFASFAGGAVRTCAFLHDRFGGPPCDIRYVLAQACEAASIQLRDMGIIGETFVKVRTKWMMQVWSFGVRHNGTTCLATRDRTPGLTTPVRPVHHEENHEAEACTPRKVSESKCRIDSDPWVFVDVLTQARAPAVIGARCDARLVTDVKSVGLQIARTIIHRGGPAMCKELKKSYMTCALTTSC